MKKIVVLAAATLLGLSSMTLSQADDVIDGAPPETTPVEAAEVQDASAEELLDAPMAAAEEAPVEEEVPVVQDTPQVQKLMSLYPLLVQRIQPYGEVCFEGEECGITLTSSGASADGEPRDGSTVYGAVCKTCHGSGLLGSPVFGDAGAWGPRIAQGKDTLYDHAINGYNTMPAKGGADIPDEEVINAVDYMVAESS